MPTVNEELRDLELSHHVGVQRLSSSIVNRIIEILDKADRNIVRQLEARGATLEGSFTSVRLQYLLRALREINADAYVRVGKALREELIGLASYEADYQLAVLQNTVPVQIDIVKPTVSQLRAVVTARPFDGKLLRDAVKDLQVGKLKTLKQALQIGVIQGETSAQIVQRIRGTKARHYKDGILNISRIAAERMVRTATNHVANAAREELYAENSKLVSKVLWVATLDTRTCASCAALDGKSFAMDKGPRPPKHLSCRCATAPVVKSWRQLGIDADELEAGTRASMDGQVPATETFNTWLKKQSAKVQDEALGPTRGALFRRGKMSIDRFVDVRGNQLTLEQLRLKEAAAFRRAKL